MNTDCNSLFSISALFFANCPLSFYNGTTQMFVFYCDLTNHQNGMFCNFSCLQAAHVCCIHPIHYFCVIALRYYTVFVLSRSSSLVRCSSIVGMSNSDGMGWMYLSITDILWGFFKFFSVLIYYSIFVLFIRRSL